jgi:hypothetical protein
VLLPFAGSLADADARLAPVAADAFGAAIDAVPDAWLARGGHAGLGDDEPDSRRGAIRAFFEQRLTEPRPWLP